MDKERILIAVASSDGIVVNRHFGRAEEFYIYEIFEDGIRLDEIRKAGPVCDGGTHDDSKMEEVFRELSDCKYLLVSRIGNGAALMAEHFGIEPYEIPGIIPESIERLRKYVEMKELLECCYSQLHCS